MDTTDLSLADAYAANIAANEAATKTSRVLQELTLAVLTEACDRLGITVSETSIARSSCEAVIHHTGTPAAGEAPLARRTVKRVRIIDTEVSVDSAIAGGGWEPSKGSYVVDELDLNDPVPGLAAILAAAFNLR